MSYQHSNSGIVAASIGKYATAMPSGLYASDVIPERLRAALDLRSMSQSDLARAVGVTQGAIHQMLTGSTKRTRYLEEIAHALGVSSAWLSGKSDDMNALEVAPEKAAIPATRGPGAELNVAALLAIIRVIARVATDGQSLPLHKAEPLAKALGSFLEYHHFRPALADDPAWVETALELGLPPELRRLLQ